MTFLGLVWDFYGTFLEFFNFWRLFDFWGHFFYFLDFSGSFLTLSGLFLLFSLSLNFFRLFSEKLKKQTFYLIFLIFLVDFLGTF